MQKTNKLYKTKKDRHGEYFDHKNNLKIERGIKNFSILPHPLTLESYEAISPGIAEKLSQIIVKEQDFRHKKEMFYSNSIQKTYRFGQLMSFLLSIILIYSTIFILTEHQNQYLATIVCASGFAFLTIINVCSFKSMSSVAKNNKH